MQKGPKKNGIINYSIKHQEGIKEGLEQAVRSMLSNTKFSPKEIAEMVGVPLSMVRKLKSGLNKK